MFGNSTANYYYVEINPKHIQVGDIIVRNFYREKIYKVIEIYTNGFWVKDEKNEFSLLEGLNLCENIDTIRRWVQIKKGMKVYRTDKPIYSTNKEFIVTGFKGEYIEVSNNEEKFLIKSLDRNFCFEGINDKGDE